MVIKRMKKAGVIAILCVFFAVISIGIANADQVLRVYPIAGGVLIQLENAGWVYASDNSLGEKQVDRIYSAALTAFTSGAETGYINPGDEAYVAGVTARPITIFQLKK